MPSRATIQVGSGRLQAPGIDVNWISGMYDPHGVFDRRADLPAETNRAASAQWVRWDG